MKKITREIELYEVSELAKPAFRKAYQEWLKDYDMPFLQSMLNDECGQMLKEHKITCTSNHPVCLYSLSNCQGDGLMFEGTFKWKGWNITIKHSGHYYHENSKTIEMVDDKDEPAGMDEEEDFNELYVSICKKLAKYGYDLIEDETSEAHFIDECNANEWTFTKDGKMDNNL